MTRWTQRCSTRFRPKETIFHHSVRRCGCRIVGAVLVAIVVVVVVDRVPRLASNMVAAVEIAETGVSNSQIASLPTFDSKSPLFYIFTSSNVKGTQRA